MTVVTIEEAQEKLADLIAQLRPGEGLIITDQGTPLAEVKKSPAPVTQSKAGSYQKAEFWMAPDFDDELEDFRDYSK
ncbi:type II toxin-antitoxin system Phd/YefM family antitoxin [Planctomicrobium piriforme]|uniref:Antitoxin component of toxin-antitoxin stability system, DNA-binding transcriptional repressor n=1 Tax=Planctomicrobium piriforme TaxID=1576369 RepID=A0A1I3J6T8_9PLAN|nr:hypothetical protein [Planctomicrobium piriforme]SFI55889.1 Antitoxin component of toxin-antitoxin stability system, DNA-binding transcriptional repressor [Planctomicrobium piriforme]